MKIAIIGSNTIALQFCAAGMLCNEFEITAIYSRTLAKAKEMAQTYGAKYAFDSLEDLANCEEIDSVYIASPNSLHFEQSMQMLCAKKHVICEKPIASNAMQLKKMIETAARNHCVLLEAMRPAHLPTMAIIKETLKTIGPVRRVVLNYCQYSSRYDKFKDGIIENAFKPELSNGALMDIGVYPAHVLVQLFGKPEQITGYAVKLANGVDGEGAILCQYDGMIGELLYSKISNSYLESEIQGENGNLILDTVSGQRNIRLIDRSGKETCLSPNMKEHDMCYEIEAFIQMTKEGTGHETFLQCSLETMELLDQARKTQGIVFPADL